LALGFESLQLQKMSYNESSDSECVLIRSADFFEGFCEDRKADLLPGEATAHIDAQKVKCDDAFFIPREKVFLRVIFA